MNKEISFSEVFPVISEILFVCYEEVPTLIGKIRGLKSLNNSENEREIRAHLEALKQFKNQTIKIGCLKGNLQVPMNFFEGLGEVVLDEFSIKVEHIYYDNYEKLKEDAREGEVDAYIGKSDIAEEGFYCATTLFASNKIIVTHIENPLKDAIQLNRKRVGFLRNSPYYLEFQKSDENRGVEVCFFDSIDAALDAVEYHKIDLFISNEMIIDQLIIRKKLQLEYAFRDKITDVSFFTTSKKVHFFITSVDKLMHTSMGKEIVEKVLYTQSQQIKEKIRAYIQSNYQAVIERYHSITVGVHNANFPYSFFDRDGTPRGICIEALELFQFATDIPVHISNSINHTELPKLIDELRDNNIQFTLGMIDERRWKEVVRVGTWTNQDNIISIIKYGNNDVTTKHLDHIRFGVVAETGLTVSQMLGTKRLTTTTFTDYQSAILGLMNEEIDVLLARESALTYYRDILGNELMVQCALFDKVGSQGFLGNGKNQDLNVVMAEVQRLYYLIHIESQKIKWKNMKIDYRSEYIQLQKKQRKYEFSLVMLPFSFLTSIAFYFFLKKRKENMLLKAKSERDQLTGLYNRYVYKEKCLELIEKYPDTLGAFFFIDLDNFKNFNDRYGHIVGDQVLNRFGQALKSLEDERTVSFRIAGDEFGIFRVGFQDKREVMQEAQQMKQKMGCEIVINDFSHPIKFSAGVSIYNLDTSDFRELQMYADAAMYQAKKKKNEELYSLKWFELEHMRGNYCHFDGGSEQSNT